MSVLNQDQRGKLRPLSNFVSTKNESRMKKPSESYLLLFEKAWINFELLKKESPSYYKSTHTKENYSIKNSKREWVLNRY